MRGELAWGMGSVKGKIPMIPNEVIPFHSNSNLTTFAVLLNMVQADGE
jgi:hypothetical protein